MSEEIKVKDRVTFSNVDEAKEYPLIQKLFHLPFVKSVSLSGQSIEIEKFDIIDWEIIKDEVVNLINDEIISGTKILKSLDQNETPISFYAEMTPNPEVLKFVSNRIIFDFKWECKTIGDAEGFNLAVQLFKFNFVKSLFFNLNHVSIEKYPHEDWQEKMHEIREFLTNFFKNQTLEISPNIRLSIYKNVKERKLETDEERIINELLDQKIRPVVAQDGGNIEFISYDPDLKQVQVILQGACSGCPSATITLKDGIESLLKNTYPDLVKTVLAVH